MSAPRPVLIPDVNNGDSNCNGDGDGDGDVPGFMSISMAVAPYMSAIFKSAPAALNSPSSSPHTRLY